MKYISFFGCLLFNIVILSSNSLHAQTGMKLVIEQGYSQYEIIGDYTDVTLSRTSFILNFDIPRYQTKKKKHYALQLYFSEKDVRATDFIEGTRITETAWFAHGSGIAAPGTGEYLEFETDTDGHYYIYYENDQHARAKLIKPGKKLRLAAEIRSLMDTNNKSFPGDSVILLMVIDYNRDGVLQQGEFHKIKILWND
jgi:hypothetical protein